MSADHHNRLPPNLAKLEAESIHIFREVAATCSRPVLLYSIGKDSSVLLRLAQKAFHPGRIPFPLLHIDTTWKFAEMIRFRDETARQLGIDLIVHTNAEGLAAGISPFVHGSSVYTDIMKTQSLRQALDLHRFNCAVGGARRDEEKSRAKERIFSIRAEGHRWDPKRQRPELWSHYNTELQPGESLRVFPLSNWTEREVWEYIAAEDIPVVPLYFAALRPVVDVNGMLIVPDDARMVLPEPVRPTEELVRFRTLGCWPLTAAIRSSATNVQAIISELRISRLSERQGRLIDSDTEGSMEKKKVEGYF